VIYERYNYETRDARGERAEESRVAAVSVHMRDSINKSKLLKILIGFILCREFLDIREPNVNNVSGMRR